jgi:hypothetical protein
MIRTSLKVVLADFVLLLVVFYVSQDLQWRAAYAATAHDACGGLCSYSPAFSYDILTQYFTMTGNGASLTSPPTFAWGQLVTLALAVLNAWYLYTAYTRRKRGRMTAQTVQPAMNKS